MPIIAFRRTATYIRWWGIDSIRRNQCLQCGEGSRVVGWVHHYYLFDRHPLADVDFALNILDAFTKAALPFLLVASKCDAPLNIHPTAIEHLGPFGGVEPMQTTANSASHKICFARILNTIIARRNGGYRDFPLSVYCSFHVYVDIELEIFPHWHFMIPHISGYGWFHKIEFRSYVSFNYLSPNTEGFLSFRWTFLRSRSLRKPGGPQLHGC